MKWTFLPLSAVFFITLVLFLQDAEIKAGIDRLSEMSLSPPPTGDADPNLRLVSEHSPYMRNER